MQLLTLGLKWLSIGFKIITLIICFYLILITQNDEETM